MEVRKIENLKDSEGAIIGSRIRVKIVKNKVAPPFKETQLEIYYGEGISKESSALEAGVTYAAVEKKGNHFYFEEKSLGNGKDNALKFLKENPDVLVKIINLVREQAGLTGKEPVKEPREKAKTG